MEQLERKIREVLPRLKELTNIVELFGSVLLLISMVIIEVIIRLQKKTKSTN